MLQKILFVVMPTEEALRAARFVADLARTMGAQIIALNVVDSSAARQMAGVSGAREAEVIVQMEEDGWHYLYDVEDVSKDLGARIVLQQEEGFPETRIAEAVRRFKVDIVAVPRVRASGHAQARYERMIASLVSRLEVPVTVI
jgi:nucleotide-binding universal stress UspA family protein